MRPMDQPAGLSGPQVVVVVDQYAKVTRVPGLSMT